MVVVLEFGPRGDLIECLVIFLRARLVEPEVQDRVVEDLLVVTSALSIQNLRHIEKEMNERSSYDKLMVAILTLLCKLSLMSSVVSGSSWPLSSNPVYSRTARTRALTASTMSYSSARMK